jgi:glycine/D-amino acid oxidase-like deaminating enzyme/nitrite reductase/ring-hydroxylating ferredoxin subunit
MSPQTGTPLGKAESLWIDTAPPTHYPTFSPNDQPDVIVVGGGIAGLTTAYLLQAEGIRTVVLEMDRIVRGVTGHTTAKVTSLHTLIYDHLIRQFGEEQARMYGAANQAGLEKIAELSSKLSIECDFKRTTAYTFAQTGDETRKIEAEVEAAQRLGLPASYASDLALPMQTFGAVAFRDQAQFHPRKYLLGLAQAFEQLGGRIYENTRVLQIREDRIVGVQTDRGEFGAPFVVIASHYPMYDPALYFARLAARRSMALALRIEGDLPQGMYISSSEPMFSIRNQPTPDGDVLIFGGKHFRTGQEDNILFLYEQLATFAREHFRVRSIDYHWSTQDCQTPDHVPYIGAISPSSKNVFVATGFNGWGMTNGTASGIILSDKILKRENAWAEVFNPSRVKPFAATGELIGEGISVAREIIGGLLPKAPPEEVRNLSSGEGRVIQLGRDKVAVARNATGDLRAVSALCTHMGCVVKWNNAEMSWDCPCHGSRFDTDGKVIQGPATKDLESKSLD